MHQSTAEIIILTSNALGAGLLLFIAGVIQKIMNGMDEIDFKKFVNTLDKTAMSNPFAVTISTVPILFMILYFVKFGFDHWWFTAGVVVWVLGSIATKLINMPVYKWLGDPKHTDRDAIRRQRRKLQLGNNVRAWLTFASVILMACQLDTRYVSLAVVVCAVLAVPSLLLSRKYIPSN